MEDEIQKLSDDLIECVPEYNDDGVLGDGSYETMASVYERAFDRAYEIASKAIRMLRHESLQGSRN
jgi:hypothetical protein